MRADIDTAWKAIHRHFRIEAAHLGRAYLHRTANIW